MPELPEVETVRRGLVPVWEGRRLIRVTCYRANLRTSFPEGFAQILTGKVVERLERRAKYLLIRLSGELVLIIHLGMSGRMTIAPSDTDPIKTHDHVVFVTDQGVRVSFNDPRRFGLMALSEGATLDQHPLLVNLGPEPLDDAFTAGVLHEALSGRATPIKSALLDQKTVSGLGNIYVCESLFRAGIHPERLAKDLPKAAITKLTKAIKDVLLEAIEAGGSTLRDHQRPDGELGYFQHQFGVYDQEGKPCPGCTCSRSVERIVQAGRSTFFCPTKQK